MASDLPVFASPAFNTPRPFFYFHHIIDAEKATLTVEVIGPNLRFTFTHSRAKRVLNTSEIRSRLDRKTVGFVALVHGDSRHVLAWGESGHGLSRTGDVLDAPPNGPVLANTLWTRRVIHLANILGIGMASPFDKPAHSIRPGETAESRTGVFRGCHVEVKLAAYAVHLMLDRFNITRNLNDIKRAELDRLRSVLWENGTRPAFEIYFSRKNCGPCGNLVRAIEEATGMKITLHWRDRLEKKEYKLAKVSRQINGASDTRAAQVDQVIVIEDDTDIVETTDNSSESGTANNNTTTEEEEEDEANQIDLTDSPTPRGASIDMEEFVRKLREYAFKVDASPRTRDSSARSHPPRLQPMGDIVKPLPATPVTEFPQGKSPQRVPSTTWWRMRRRYGTSTSSPSARRLARKSVRSRRDRPVVVTKTLAGQRSPRPYQSSNSERTVLSPQKTRRSAPGTRRTKASGPGSKDGGASPGGSRGRRSRSPGSPFEF